MSTELTRAIERQPPHGVDARAGLEGPAGAELQWLLQVKRARARALDLLRAHESRNADTLEPIGSYHDTDGEELDRDAQLVARYLIESRSLFELTVVLTGRSGA